MLPTAMGAIGLIEIDRHDGSTDVELMGESEHRICVGCIRAKLNVRLLKRAKEEKRLKTRITTRKRESRKNHLEYQLRSAKISSDAKKNKCFFFLFSGFSISTLLSSFLFFSWYVLYIT
jgi:hypothetical protein